MRILFFTRYLFNLKQTSFSKSLERTGTIDIGLHWEGLEESSPLNIGVTLAIFNDLGNTPSKKHSFIRLLSIGDSDLAPNFRILE